MKYPDGNPKTPFGMVKPGLTNVPFGPLFEVGRVMEFGAAKYGPANWRDDPVTASTYINAALRHIMMAWDGEPLDPETGCAHLAHAIADLLIVLDADMCGTLTIDKPTAGRTAQAIRTMTRIKEIQNVANESNPSDASHAGASVAERELPSAGSGAEQPSSGD